MKIGKKVVAVTAAVTVGVVAMGGVAYAAYSGTITNAISAIGEGVSPTSCDTDGVDWEFGNSFYSQQLGDFAVRTLSWSGVSANCNGLTMQYSLVDSNGASLRDGQVVGINATSGSTSFMSDILATDLDGASVKYIIQ